MLSSNFTYSNPSYMSNPSFPSNRLNKSTNFKTLFDTTKLPYNKPDLNKLCYTVSKGTFIYKPHTDVGMVGRSAAGYLAQRKRM